MNFEIIEKGKWKHKRKYQLYINDSYITWSIHKDYLQFIVDKINHNEKKWLMKKDNKYKLKFKELLRELWIISPMFHKL